MIYVLSKVLFFITIILSIYNLYFVIMTGIGMFSRNKNMSGEFKNHKIAIVIPCRNEETVIYVINVVQYKTRIIYIAAIVELK